MRRLNLKFLNERAMRKLLQKKLFEMNKTFMAEKWNLFRDVFVQDEEEEPTHQSLDSFETIDIMAGLDAKKV